MASGLRHVGAAEACGENGAKGGGGKSLQTVFLSGLGCRRSVSYFGAWRMVDLLVVDWGPCCGCRVRFAVPKSYCNIILMGLIIKGDPGGNSPDGQIPLQASNI